MQPTSAVKEFISRLSLPPGPGISLEEALKPALDDEADLRVLFARDRKNPRLSDPYVGLLDVFNTSDHIKLTRARVVQGPEDHLAKYVFPLSEANRRKEGVPCIVPGMDEFQKNWSIFTEGSLSQLFDWNNVVAAGGSVLACLTPLEEASKISKRAMRKHYHNKAYPSSDVDLFLWGLTPEQAEVKILAIYEAVRDSVPWDVTCLRTKHTVSIHSQYPYRSVQIVLRLYQSPAEILAGFDIDAPCCAYDGTRVWANPRAVAAVMRQCNTVDMTRRSPSYEVRLAKYAKRGFEVYVPDLRREDVDPTIYERSIARMEGLARLLVLEHLSTTLARDTFLQSRRTLRGRAMNLYSSYMDNRKKYKGDLKADETVFGLVANDYDVATLHVPYGPGWDAARISKLVYQTDLGMNSTFNPKNKGRRLHRHPAFFGVIQECLEDCCETCPEPIDDDERNTQAKEDEMYIRGRIKFIEENPGRQSISGSFNPIDAGEWSEQAYLKPTQQLFIAIAAHELSAVQKLIVDGIDVNQRDHVGRTSLHVAIFAGAPKEIAYALIDAGARISARLVDGRGPLHLAAKYDRVDVVQKLFERNAKNVAEEEKKNPKEDDKDGDKEMKVDDAIRGGKSSEDDWSSHEDEDIEMVDDNDGSDEEEDNEEGGDDDHDDEEGANDQDGDEDGDGDDGHSKPEDSPSPGPPDQIPDEDNQPDIIEVNIPDWDFGFSALSYAVLFASIPLMELLVKEGADIKLPTKPPRHSDAKPMHPLSLTILREEEEEACRIAEYLIGAGATCSTADNGMWTILHSVVSSGKAKLLAQILKSDPHAASMLNFPSIKYQDVIFPVITAINKQNYAAFAVMLAHNVRLEFDEADITRAQNAEPSHQLRLGDFLKNYVQLAHQCVEVALANNDDVVQLLLAFGAPNSLAINGTLNTHANKATRRTILDWVEFTLNVLNGQIKRLEASAAAATLVKHGKSGSPWRSFLHALRKSVVDRVEQEKEEQQEKQEKGKEQKLKDTKEYLEEVKRLLQARGAKSWKAVYPEIESTASSRDPGVDSDPVDDGQENSYAYISKVRYPVQSVPQHLASAYDELYEACFTGDNDKLTQLCMPDEKANGKGNTRALNIFVQQLNRIKNTFTTEEGYSPLFAAIVGKQWSTAKLVMSIAYAQHNPEDPKERQFRTSSIALDDESSDEDNSSDADSDMTVEQVGFVDVVSKSSSIKSRINPHKLLLSKFRYGKTAYEEHNLLTMAVVDGDLDTFIHIANLCQSLPKPLDLNENILDSIICYDRPEMLEEFIRRTGLGINMVDAQKSSEGNDAPPSRAVNDKNRIYLGLNIHGKKRTDLATKDDPDAQLTESSQHPILWRAIHHSAKGIIEYLAGGQPLVAYRLYASTHTNERAVWLGKMKNLEKKLPVWLGWTIDALGQSPLIIAALSKDVEILRLLFVKSPQFMETTVHKKISIVGYNPLMLSVFMSCDAKFIDFLLEKSISPIECDLTLGWNIYHHICRQNNLKLLEHLLDKFPRELNETLLVQQSKGLLETPLQIAIKNKNKALIHRVIEYSPKSVFLRDVNGSTPLHNAVHQTLPEITELLLCVVSNEALQMEDGVGSTVLEIIYLLDLKRRVDHYAQLQNDSPGKIGPGKMDVESHNFRPRYDKTMMDRLEEELPKLRAIIAHILPDERKNRRTKVIWELNTFVAMIEARLKKEKVAYDAQELARKEIDKKDGEVEQDREDLRATLLLVHQAVESRPAKRQLIHVADVQRSVAADLKLAAKQPRRNEHEERRSKWLDDEAEGAEEIERKAFARSMVGFVNIQTEEEET